MRTYYEWVILVSNDGWQPDFRDYQVCMAAVTSSGWMLSYIPQDMRDYALCLTAVTSVGLSLEDVPMHLRDYEMCRTAVLSNRDALRAVPKDLSGRTFLEILAGSNENI
jgi:hypothetical protein